MKSIAITTTDSALTAKAQALAIQLNIPVTTTAENYDYLLLLTPTFLGLQKTHSTTHPLYVDFLAPELTQRRKQASVRREAIARALGLKNNMTYSIVDATAGLARDSFILASLGFSVTLLERSPIIHALLEDGLNRAKKHPELAAIISRMTLIQTDAITWLKQAEKPQLIYLDPMFPERRKSALVKKNMQFFQDIIGEDPDSVTLLTTALTCATQRVVVKRPRLAPTLTDRIPHFNLSGSSSRFDIYLL